MGNRETALELSATWMRLTRKDLAQCAQVLSERIAHLAKTLSTGSDHAVSSLGEVQRMGTEIDRLCGVLAAQREAHELLKSVLDAVAKEE